MRPETVPEVAAEFLAQTLAASGDETSVRLSAGYGRECV
jgi:hypothetical protein